jgi:hypothetical protein
MSEPSRIDYALGANSKLWLQHPVVGSPSWDTIERDPNNPIYIGKFPYEWPVNGFLFHDPPSKVWYAYIGLYPKNYWPAGGCLLLKEESIGKWKEIGIILEGNSAEFDGDGERRGGMPDVSVVYDNGRYHMIYDWANPTNTKGGIAYAWAESPEGPFHRDNTPVHLDIDQPMLLGRYQRIYAATLLRREKDWLILAMMSTPRNDGVTWALVGLTSNHPGGPYSEPIILLSPQSQRFHPPLAEFYPAFESDNKFYVPATSVAKNRTFQVLFCVAKEKALDPEQWTFDHYGGIWHDRPDLGYEQGIWGQTFSGQLYNDTMGRLKLRMLSFTKTINNIGAAIISQCDWPYQFTDGFQIASPFASASAILIPNFEEFELDLEIKTTGPWCLCWGCTNPIGPSHNGADCVNHAFMMRERLHWEFNKESIECYTLSKKGKKTIIAQNRGLKQILQFSNIKLVQKSDSFTLNVQESIFGPFSFHAKIGRIELIPIFDSVLTIKRFIVRGLPNFSPIMYLATEGIIGAACEKTEWQKIHNNLFKYNEGFISRSRNARAKWNISGSTFGIISPKHPKLGKANLIVDGKLVSEINYGYKIVQKSSIIFQFSVPSGNHAIALECKEGQIVLDGLICISP